MIAFLLTNPLGRRILAGAAVLVAVVALLAEVRHGGANAIRKQDAKAFAQYQVQADSVKVLSEKGQAATAKASEAVKAAQPAIQKARQGAQKLSVFVPVGSDECARVEASVEAVREALK